MKIGFAGAGGVGCYFGGLMSRAGFDVLLIGRGEHIQTIGRQGLQMVDNGERFRVEPSIADTGQPVSLNQISELDWLFVTCKSHQNDALIGSISPFLSDHTRVVSLQNGVDGPIDLAQRLGRPVYGGLTIRFVSHITAPGRVENDGRGYIRMGTYPFGSDPALIGLWAEMQAAGVDLQFSLDIRRELWGKLIINNGVNALCALLQKDCETVFSDKSTAALVEQMMRETIAAARAEDVHLTESDLAHYLGIISSLGPVKPSMLNDREHGQPLELDAIPGAVISRAKRLGIEVPVTETVDSLLRFELRNS